MQLIHRLIAVVFVGLSVACDGGSGPLQNEASERLDEAAEAYVRTALGFGQIDASYVDAYFGPTGWRDQAISAAVPLERLVREAADIVSALESIEHSELTEIERSRHATLHKRVAAMLLRMQMASGALLSFDAESQTLFDSTTPKYALARSQPILRTIELLVPGDGPLPARLDAFRQQFIIPPERLAAVFDAAINECRQRTLQYIELPENEDFEVEYVSGQPWSGYNWYKGDNFSLIQVNTDLPIYISRAVDLGCHEGYPGHHTLNVLIEQNLVKQRGWVEYTLSPLYGPQSLISEGTANFGIAMAFPGDERIAFEKQVLFPLAGLDPREADRYYEVQRLLSELDYAGNEAARDYLNGDIDRATAIERLITYSLASPQRAEQRIRFFDAYRSYVINYNLGRDLVSEYVTKMAGDDISRRWRAFGELLASPLSPSDLRAASRIGQ